MGKVAVRFGYDSELLAAVSERLARDLRRWKLLAELFNAYPRASYRLVCLPPSRQVIMSSTALG